MKKSIIVALLALAVGVPSAFAQSISPNAIGVRLEGNDGLGPEISYQRALGDNNRLELDLGFHDSRYIDAFKFTGLYHWVFNIQGGFNWYAGLGAGVGFIDYDDKWPGRDPDDDYETVFLTFEGDFGLEYSFLEMGVPIQLALDLNPEIQLINDDYDRYYDDDFDLDVAFAIRYQF
ncbi:MAG TPA: hypothetical protein DCG19_12340 [Cryomorphaceae bacterium]|nr:hypothetical protein [Owenweeksia sp.]MBF99350.1 hypothetical protein [Owenweeksia sp.]HAD98190.1 hypothetical protein [Cryomorphaceae bacterium]HBF20376.1 hypothetical protein [Cryomorphaceae bacterium]|tara:strand:+ start:296 stop:823 length:528 start_codon:yes stop_codon:yes gene_type:complete